MKIAKDGIRSIVKVGYDGRVHKTFRGTDRDIRFANEVKVLKALEERGTIRRGYFVAGLGAAQFALAGAVDRLRDHREAADGTFGRDAVEEVSGEMIVLAATDPAQPYGAALPWPDHSGRVARLAGAHVILAGGHPVAFVDVGGRKLVTFPAAADHPAWPDAVAGLVRRGRNRQMSVEQIDGESSAGSDWAQAFRTAGFTDGYKGLTMRGR